MDYYIIFTSLNLLLTSSTCGALIALSGFIHAWHRSSLKTKSYTNVSICILFISN